MKKKYILVSLILPLLSIHIINCQPQPSPFGQMNETEMKQLETEMASFQKEIESLSPQEQESFFKSMEQAVQKIDDLSKTDEGKALLDKLDKGDISDAELDQLMNQIVGETPPQEVVEQEAPKKPKKIKPKPVISSKHAQAIDLLKSLERHTNEFIVKVASMPGFPGKLRKWERYKQIDWRPSLTWNILKNKLEHFISQLSLLLERDPKTKEYYHLDALLKEENVYNALKKIEHVIAKYEPQIEETTPLRSSLGKESKQALQKMINQYIEAIYTLKIIQELTTLIAKFESKAKASRQREEKAFKQAELEGRKKLMPGAPITVGQPDRGYVPSSDAYDRDFDQPSRRYTPSYKEPSYERPSYSPLEKKPETPGAARRSTPAKTPDKKEKDKEDDAKKEETPFEKLKKQAEEIDKRALKEQTILIERIEENIVHLASTLKKTEFFANLEKKLTDESEIDLAIVTEVVPDLMRDLSMRRGAIGTLQELQRKIPATSARMARQKELQKLYDKHKKPIDAAYNQLKAIEDKWGTLAKTIPASKRYAYFGQVDVVEQAPIKDADIDHALKEIEEQAGSVEEGLEKAAEYLESIKKQPVDEGLKQIKEKVPTPVSLFDLKKAIDQLKENINTFAQKKLKTK